MKAKHSRNWLSRLPHNWLRVGINLWSPFLGAGIKVTYVSEDYRHIEVRLKMRWYNRNYVGTHFGGSIYSMTDPFYMLMLIKNLGSDYIIWDKASFIEFKKPGRGTLHAIFKFPEDELNVIKGLADKNGKHVFDRSIDVLNEQGEVVASIVKTLYVRKKTKPV